MKIWIIKVDTESSDHGFSGYFLKKPTAKKVKAWLKEYYPEDFEAGTAYTEVLEFEEERTHKHTSDCYETESSGNRLACGI